MGNGAKAQLRRERNAKETKGGKSQLKTNQQAMTIICNICRQNFMQTTRKPALEQHVEKIQNSSLENELAKLLDDESAFVQLLSETCLFTLQKVCFILGIDRKKLIHFYAAQLLKLIHKDEHPKSMPVPPPPPPPPAVSLKPVKVLEKRLPCNGLYQKEAKSAKMSENIPKTIGGLINELKQRQGRLRVVSVKRTPSGTPLNSKPAQIVTHQDYAIEELRKRFKNAYEVIEEDNEFL